MRIGVMLRTIDEKFGIGIYSQNIVEAFIKSYNNHKYILFYKDEKHLGKYADYPNVEEKVIKSSSKLYWDQVAIPFAAKKAEVDILFHTKFTVPLLTTCKTVMVLHGASWFVHPELYKNKLDLAYIKMIMPFYCRKANAIISNSNLTKNDFINILHVPSEKIRTIYFGVNPIFKQVNDQKILNNVKEKYNLPDSFILTVSRYDPRKNFGTIFKAFTKCQDARVMKLVAVGKDSDKYRIDYNISKFGFENDVIFPGYIEQNDLPAVYNLAKLFIFPSVYEEFGIPLLEAMACGCPIVASNTGAIPEITGDAAFLGNPFDADSMANGIDQITHDSLFRQSLIEKGLQRAKLFNWGNAARETLKILEQVVLNA